MRMFIDWKDFEDRTGIARDADGPWSKAEGIVSLRDLTVVSRIETMHLDYLESLLGAVTLAGHPDRRPYAGCRVVRTQMDPHTILVGQKFVERAKCAVWFEDSGLDRLFQRLDVETGPLSKRTMRVLGTTADGFPGIAHYLTPIVEEYDNQAFILDGIHRSHVARRLHPHLQVIAVMGVQERPPFSLHEWREVEMVDRKPPLDQRFFDLDPGQFRDMKSVGIDG